MRFLASLLLPLTVLAQTNTLSGGEIVGNPVGEVLGLFAMCGTSPVDCGNGWCCLAGQTCTTGKNGPDTMCTDPSLVSSSGQTGAVVNAAFFGKETSNQLSPAANGTVAPKTTGTAVVSTGSGSQMPMPENWLLISVVLGSSSLVLSFL